MLKIEAMKLCIYFILAISLISGIPKIPDVQVHVCEIYTIIYAGFPTAWFVFWIRKTKEQKIIEFIVTIKEDQ